MERSGKMGSEMGEKREILGKLGKKWGKKTEMGKWGWKWVKKGKFWEKLR